MHSQNDSRSAPRFCCYWCFSATVPLTEGRHRSNPAQPEAVELGRRPRNGHFALCRSRNSSRCCRGGVLYLFHYPSPAWVEADQRLSPTVPNLRGPDTTASTSIDQRPSADEKAAAAYLEAAEAILRRAPNVRASAGGDEPPITGPSRCQKGARSRAHDFGIWHPQLGENLIEPSCSNPKVRQSFGFLRHCAGSLTGLFLSHPLISLSEFSPATPAS